MSVLKKLALVAAPLALGLLTTPALVAAQTTDSSRTTNAQNVPFNGTACPPGYERGSYRTPDRNNTNICYDRRSDAARSTTNVAKPNRLDRCPLAYFTSDVDPNMCTTRLVNPPTIRVKGSGPCRTGEVEDWGIWCVSNYAGLPRDQANTALRDWNAVYTLNRGTPPRQADLPEGSQYTPAYITIFGRVHADGRPMAAAGASSATAAAPAAPVAAAAPAAPSGPRFATLNPQRQTPASPFCPSGWMDGTNPNTGARDPGMCFPMPDIAQASYPRGSENEACAPGHVLNGTWCSRDPNAPMAATQPGQTAPNCPPAGNSTAQQAGAALGGLLGGRRGNAQAGAALGGLLGQAAGGAQRPPGC